MIKYAYCAYCRKNRLPAAVKAWTAVAIAPPIIPCPKDEGRKEICQGRKMQECFRISSFSDAEKFSLCRVSDGKV